MLANETVLSHLVPYPKDIIGYDLMHLFIGSEGPLGVITKAVLRLHPAPSTTSTALLSFDSLDAGARTLNRMQRDLAGTLSSFELVWNEPSSSFSALFSASARRLVSAIPFTWSARPKASSRTDAAMFESAVATALEAETSPMR
ncbi:FAD-binding oxidoreductase [Tianweitania populi]|uniref:FAD-binding oxidoreductase n=1 Tax=Tianweitania populi TaxID=1607949 RepID=A0A8J3GLH0_9HYPH|nr:FAD-binding oxidoreductase [Tianweitania populi]GHD21682.1 hypothetical protein GCM10016234_35240 [Tianweitania populi]